MLVPFATCCEGCRPQQSSRRTARRAPNPVASTTAAGPRANTAAAKFFLVEPRSLIGGPRAATDRRRVEARENRPFTPTDQGA